MLFQLKILLYFIWPLSETGRENFIDKFIEKNPRTSKIAFQAWDSTFSHV